MIGVIAKPGQLKAVEEFFQLFKTPWEFYHASKSYPVVIATCGDVSNVHTKLLLIYSAGITPIDSEIGIASGRSLSAACVSHRGKSLPIYGQCRAFDGASDGRCCVTAGPERVGVMVTRRDSTVIRLGYDLFEELDYLLSSGQPLDNAGTPTLDVHIEMLKAWIVEHGISLLEIPPVPAGHTFTVCLTHDIDFIGIRGHKFDHTMWGFLYRSTVGAMCDYGTHGEPWRTSRSSILAGRETFGSPLSGT